MQLSFSTLGCPAWTFEDVLTHAKRWGFDGIEFRGLLTEIDLEKVPEFSPAQIARTRERLEAAKLRAVCLSSSVQVVAAVTDEADRRHALGTAKHYIDMANEVGAPLVRLFCGDVPTGMLSDEAFDRASALLRTLGDYAQARQVTAVVETHDAFMRSDLLADLLRLTNHPAVQALWDIHHPYRYAGETVEQTVRHLRGHIRYTHVKDSVLHDDGSSTYVPVGVGDVPIPDALRALHAEGYDGFLTLEWEKRWHPELTNPEIVFPHYAEQMRAWLAEVE
jgi:sugar phosphate isomerase/epimerase